MMKFFLSTEKPVMEEALRYVMSLDFWSLEEVTLMRLRSISEKPAMMMKEAFCSWTFSNFLEETMLALLPGMDVFFLGFWSLFREDSYDEVLPAYP